MNQISNSKLEGPDWSEEEVNAAGGEAPGKEDLGQELEIKFQHATSPFRWKGAADISMTAGALVRHRACFEVPGARCQV